MERAIENANKELAKKFFELFEAESRNEVKALWAPNYTLHYPGISNPLTSAESLEKMKEYNNAFPDLKFTIQYQVCEGDTVVTRMAGRGTHKGEFQGIAPTNKKVSTTGISIHRIKEGRIVEETIEFDALGLLLQLGGITLNDIAEHATHEARF